jgi:hypothetical protein
MGKYARAAGNEAKAAKVRLPLARQVQDATGQQRDVQHSGATMERCMAWARWLGARWWRHSEFGRHRGQIQSAELGKRAPRPSASHRRGLAAQSLSFRRTLGSERFGETATSQKPCAAAHGRQAGGGALRAAKKHRNTSGSVVRHFDGSNRC